MISVRVDDHLESATEHAARSVGLRTSDLVRIGLIKVIAEIRETGGVVATTIPAPAPTPAEKEVSR